MELLWGRCCQKLFRLWGKVYISEGDIAGFWVSRQQDRLHFVKGMSHLEDNFQLYPPPCFLIFIIICVYMYACAHARTCVWCMYINEVIAQKTLYLLRKSAPLCIQGVWFYKFLKDKKSKINFLKNGITVSWKLQLHQFAKNWIDRWLVTAHLGHTFKVRITTCGK